MKAFDTVWHPGLWDKVLNHTVNGKMYDIIVNIRSHILNGSEFSGPTWVIDILGIFLLWYFPYI